MRRRGRCGGPHGIGPGCAGRHVGNLGRRAMYLPPVLRPPAVAGPEPPAAQLLAEAAVSVVRGAPGSYAAERLADVVRGWGRWGDSVWLRLRDVRSTDLAGSLAAACQHRWSHADDGTGPTIVAADLRGTLDEGPDGGVVVIGLGGRATPEVVELIGTIRPTVTRRRIRVIVVAESRWRPPVRHWPDCIVPACHLDDGGAVDRCAFPQVRALANVRGPAPRGGRGRHGGGGAVVPRGRRRGPRAADHPANLGVAGEVSRDEGGGSRTRRETGGWGQSAEAIRRTASSRTAGEVARLRRTNPLPFSGPYLGPDPNATFPRRRNADEGSSPRPRSRQSSQAR